MIQKITLPSVAELITASVNIGIPPVSGAFTAVSWEIIDLEKHIPLVYDWVRLPYSKQFWQMDHLNFDEFYEHYHQMLNGQSSTSLMGSLHGRPICQVELYDCHHDEISRHYTALPGDIGLHFLMAPRNEVPVHGVSLLMMRSVISLLLGNKNILRVMGEPDIRNEKANSLVRKAGFRFLKQINMSYKQANLYECTRETILK